MFRNVTRNFCAHITRLGVRRSLTTGTRSRTDIAIAHSSWFRIPEQKMEKFELLARGSAFCVRGPESGVTIALASAHVSAPHRYRRYFPAEWLSFVEDKHVQVQLDVRSEDGRVATPVFETHSLVQAYRHATLDVSAVVVLPPGSTSPPGIQILNMSDDSPADAHGREVLIAGHVIDDDGSNSEGGGLGIVRRAELPGRVSLVDGASRGFVYTGKEDSVMGMCGGPVVSSTEGDVVLGMLEGLVPRLQKGAKPISEQHQAVCGHSVFVTAEELRHFVRDVERDWLKTAASRKEGMTHARS